VARDSDKSGTRDLTRIEVVGPPIENGALSLTAPEALAIIQRADGIALAAIPTAAVP
jgi:hypothetical protein